RTSSKYPSRRISQEFFSTFLHFFLTPHFHWLFYPKISLPTPQLPSKTPSAPPHFSSPTHLFCLYPSAQPRYFSRRNVSAHSPLITCDLSCPVDFAPPQSPRNSIVESHSSR